MRIGMQVWKGMGSGWKLWAFAMVLAGPLGAQEEWVSYRDPAEVRLPEACAAAAPDANGQALLRHHCAGWRQFAAENPRWRAVMDARTGLPHRAFGPGIAYAGLNVLARTQAFAAEHLLALGLPDGLEWTLAQSTGKHDWAFATQTLEGFPVIGTRATVKWRENEVVLWGVDWYPQATLPEGEWLSELQLRDAAVAGLELDVWGAVEPTGYQVLPLPGPDGRTEFRLIQEWMVNGRSGALPRRYKTWVDVHSGQIHLRENLVRHIDGRVAVPATEGKPERAVLRMGLDRPSLGAAPASAMLVVSGQVQADVHVMYPFEPQESAVLPHLQINIGSTNLYADADGGFVSNAAGPASGNLSLTGRWSTVYTAGTTPSTNVSWSDGYNNVTLNNLGNVRERSAYRSTSLIHDHMKTWLPDFDGCDESLTTNLDVAGECNAFYDGSSINFYNLGGGCNPTSLIADVVWHEYGHFINDRFYQSLGAFFQNGAMNEGYADLWAMSLGDIAEIGKGFYTDNEDGIRKYDAEPKVYPQDLVGEVHADGEIIAGAWYDTHLLLGGDWTTTMTLFADAFPGLQATAQNGNEGQAFTDVLIDVLQADDDDADLSNGTPNDLAIVEGFDIHGITLFSYAEIDHDSEEFAEAETPLEIVGSADIVFPYSLYFDAVRLWYKTSFDGDWTSVPMAQDGSEFVGTIPAQEPGTVVAYYLGITDDFGGLSAVTPLAAAEPGDLANLPHFTLVGVEPQLINDSDEYSDFGGWTTGVPAWDNATTGLWDEAIPVGSYAEANDPSTVVAPTQDHTVGLAGFCFVTGVNPGVNAGIGANDVDQGSTTLLSPVIDLTEFVDPVMTYWRWYVNAPPSGANPATDWWQVQVTSDGGDTWTYVENTKQQDISWRRMAFRVADVVELTPEFRMRFIASDSLRLGDYLDGGSLVEAAVDDIILYDLAVPQSVSEPNEAGITALVMPNPAVGTAYARGWKPGAVVSVFSAEGRLLLTTAADGAGEVRWDLAGWPVGTYLLRGRQTDDRRVTLRMQVQH